MRTLGNSIIRTRLINWTSQWAAPQTSFERVLNSAPCYGQIFVNDIRSRCSPALQDCGTGRTTSPQIWVNDQVLTICESKHQALHQFNRELTRMDCLSHMIVFDVWNGPNVTGVLSKWVAGILTCFHSHIVYLSVKFSRSSNRVQI